MADQPPDQRDREGHLMANNYRLAILILEQKAQEYEGIAINGQYRYGDPQHEIDRWREMGQECLAGAEALKGLK
jgi:hypothetical protein